MNDIPASGSRRGVEPSLPKRRGAAMFSGEGDDPGQQKGSGEHRFMSQIAFKLNADVGLDGKLELKVPVAEGTRVEILVLTPDNDEFADLVAAASSNLDFWNNRWDDEDWNDA